MRLVGLAQGDPHSTRTVSGAPKFVLDALERRYGGVQRRSVELSPWQRRLVAARTFHPVRERWASRFYWHGRHALEARSRNAQRALATLDAPYDLALAFFGLFRVREAPHVMFTDNTIAISRRGWPAWVAVEGEELRRLMEWEREMFADCLHIFTQARHAADSIRDDYGIPEERLSVVGTGANFDPLPVVGEREREPAILFVGKYWELKGADVLLEAFRALRRRVPEARLWMVGHYEGPREEPGVEILGYVHDRDRLADLYARASVYCLPSRLESSGNSIIEAMSFGLPCVASDVGGLPDVVQHGQTGLLVPPGEPEALAEALETVLVDMGLAGRFGAAGRERVETYNNWDAVVGRMAPALEQCVQSPGESFTAEEGGPNQITTEN